MHDLRRLPDNVARRRDRRLDPDTTSKDPASSRRFRLNQLILFHQKPGRGCRVVKVVIVLVNAKRQYVDLF